MALSCSRLVRAAVVMLCVLAAADSVRAENWPRFRGEAGIGVSGETDLPLNWDEKTGQNLLWKVSLKGMTGYSSPIVWNDRVFVTVADRQTSEQEKAKEVPDHHLLCFQASDGKQLWKTRIAPGQERAGYSIYASPTPVTDGTAVYAWFGSGVMAAVDFEGKLLWRQERTGPFDLNPGLCSSPAVFGETVLLVCDQNRGRGFVQALDKKTGEVRWEQKRPKTGACNASPLVVSVQGKPQLIVAGENILQGLKPESGEPIWWCKSLSFGASPAYGKGLLFVDKGGNESAQCVDPTGEGDVTATHVKWKIPRAAGEYSSPTISGDYIYRVEKDGIVSIYSLTSGEKLSTGRLDGFSKIISPIAAADGKVYFVSTGKSYVVKAGPELEILATNKLAGGGGNSSSPAISGGRIFVRDFDSLYCLGKKSSE